MSYKKFETRNFFVYTIVYSISDWFSMSYNNCKQSKQKTPRTFKLLTLGIMVYLDINLLL